MNYPNYQGAPAGYPAQQPVPYAQPQPQVSTAPQYAPPQPGYPQQPQPAQPGYGQQPPPPQQLAGPPPTMGDFMTQPAGGGNSLSFMQAGTSYSGFILRTVTRADIEEATEMQDRTKIAKYNDGRVKLIMKVPLLLDQPNPSYPDGTATWIVKAGDRNELLRAMEAAGATVDPELGFMRPAAGDHIVITYTHDQPSRNGMNPKKVKRVDYVVGNGQVPQLQLPPVVQGQVVQSQYGQQGLQAAASAASGYGQPYGQPPVQQVPQYYSPTPAPAGYQQQVPGSTDWQQPQYQQYAQPQPVPQAPPQQPDPALAYQQATGQQMQPMQPPPQQPGPYGQPQADWNPYAQQPAPQAPPMPAPPAPGTYPSAPAQPSAVPPPFNQAPGGPPPDWPADVPFQPGLTLAQARMAQAVKLGVAPQPPQQ